MKNLFLGLVIILRTYYGQRFQTRIRMGWPEYASGTFDYEWKRFISSQHHLKRGTYRIVYIRVEYSNMQQPFLDVFQKARVKIEKKLI